jgi:uncharacterized DUF497 family protein
MAKVQFEWDERKNKENQRKHGVSFEEARTVFLDSHAFIYFDSEHSEREDRFIIVGNSIRFRLLMVVHCYREEASRVRILSARKATSQEQKSYEESHEG